MRLAVSRIALAGVFIVLAALAPGAGSAWVQAGPDGHLAYRADERGNTIPDFSRAGYGGGGVRLPEATGAFTLGPQPSGDDGARIQAALDEAGKRPVDARGLRGAVLLRRGLYRVEGTLAIRASGVVLRGEGADEDGTVILATGKKQRTLIEVGAPRATREIAEASRRDVTDAYVPWSAKTFALASTAGLRVGDRVVLRRVANDAWIHELGMDRIKNRPGAPAGETKQWKAEGFTMDFERTITAIDGPRVTLDAPVMNALDTKFGGGAVYRYTFPRIAQCGVENLRLVSAYEKGKETSDEAHAWIAVNLGAVENAWVRDVTAVHFSHAVQASGASIFTTTQDCAHLDPVSLITGSRRYSFSLNGQYGLVQRCTARGARHTFVTGSRVPGPNVFLDGQAVQSHADSGPHHRWAVGTLYDNISDDRQLRVQDRQWAGSGHGWAGAQQVLWNCTSPTIVVQQPPTAQNYAIGCVGKFVAGDWSPNAPRGLIESEGRPVTPRSLYLAQLDARLGAAAVANVGR
ncbi:MAG: hypothetical protein Q8N18_03420 [Opitutaceae bacterium]|nr:hypothetical protein [Opitutaceae bacterium]